VALSAQRARHELGTPFDSRQTSLIDVNNGVLARSVVLSNLKMGCERIRSRLDDSISGVPVLLETPTVLRLLASGFGFRPHRSLGCKGDRSFNPPESPRFRVGGDPNKPQSCKYDKSTIVRFDHCSRFRSVPSYCAGGLRPMAERWPESKFWKIRSVML
jgi:hypothetical protein